LAALHKDGFGVDQVITISEKPSYYEVVKIAKSLKPVDTVIHPVGYCRTKDLLFVSMLNPKNVFSLDDGINWTNIKMGEATNGLYFYEIYTYILNQLGVTNVDDRFIVPNAESNIYGLKHYDIIFNPFGSKSYKSINVQKAAQTLTLISKQHIKATIGILYSPATKVTAALISKLVSNQNIEVIYGITSIQDVIAIMSNANLIISVDTSIVHIASGLNKNLIGIYPTSKNIFNPWLPKPSPNTKIIYSPNIDGASPPKDMNNFRDEELLEAMQHLYDLKI
jgi:ADP-heptose:LPS heptosyltransferase